MYLRGSKMAGFTVGRWILLVLLLLLFGVIHGNAVRAGEDLRSGRLPDDQAHARHLMNATSRIVGGRDAQKERFTYMCSLKDNNQEHVCGAVLIDPNWALTAAHCVHPEVKGAATFSALLAIGAHKRTDNDSTPGVELVEVVGIHWHPNYKPNEDEKGWDIALLRLARPSKLTPIRLPNIPHVSLPRTLPYLTLGWGTDSETLQELILEIKTEEECKSSYQNLGPNIICALGASGDTCRGDSGGPVLIPNSPNRNVNAGRSKFDALIALTSFGDRFCRRLDNPAGYTLVAPYRGWIEKIMKGPEPWCSTPHETNTTVPSSTGLQPLSSPPTSSTREPELISPSPATPLLKVERLDPRSVIYKVFVDGDYQCQGLLVDPGWIATTAHCVSNFRDSVEIASIGALIDKTLAGEVFVHPYFSVIGENDVAMIRLTEKQDDIPLPALHATASYSIKEQKLTTLIYDSGQEEVHSIKMEGMHVDQCPDENVRDDAICAGAQHTSLCLGDISGAPLLHEQSDGMQLYIGILYWAPDCVAASSVIPLLYQPVPPVVDWMKEIIALE